MEVRAQSCLEKGSFEAIPEHRGSFTWRSAKAITTLFLTIHDFVAESLILLPELQVVSWCWLANKRLG